MWDGGAIEVKERRMCKRFKLEYCEDYEFISGKV